MPRGRTSARRWRSVARLLAVVVAVLAVAALLGWATGILWLAGRIGPGRPMVPLTAVCLLALAVAVMLATRSGRASALASAALAVAAGAVAAIVLVQYVLGRDLGLDRLLFSDAVSRALPSSLGRPAAWTAVALALVAVPVALLRVERPVAATASSLSLVLALVVGELLVLGHVFDASELLQLGGSKISSMPTVAALLLLVVACAAARPDRAPLGALLGRADTRLLLWLLPLGLLLPVLEGAAEGLLEGAGVSSSTAEALASVVTGVVTAALIVWLAFANRRADSALRLERELAAERERFRVVFDAAPAGLVVCDAAGTVVEANAAFADFVGRRLRDVIGHDLRTLSSPADRDADAGLLDRVLAGEIDSYRVDKRYERPDGRRVWGDLHVSVVRDAEGGIRYAIATIADVDLRRRAEESLSDLATRDPLTGLANRAALDDVIEHYRERYGAAPAAIVFVDLDDFKGVNDRLGHAVGDALLCEVAARLGDTLRADDVVARVGGDEFVALVRLRAEADIMPLLARVRSAFVGHTRLGGELVEVAASVGGALVDERGPVDALQRADEDMYATKELRKRTSRRSAVADGVP